MSVFGPIPLPQSKDMFEGVMEQWTKQRELAQTEKYQKGMLDVHQQAEDRAKKELPYLLQKYEDEHGKSATEHEEKQMELKLHRKHFQDIMSGYDHPAEAAKGAKEIELGGEEPPVLTPANPSPGVSYDPNAPQSSINNLPAQDRSQIEAFLASGKASPAQAAAMQKFLRGPVQMGAQQAPGPQRQEVSHAGMENLANLPNFAQNANIPPEQLAKVKEFIEQQKAAQQPQAMPAPAQMGAPAPEAAQPGQQPLVQTPAIKLPGVGANDLEQKFNSGEEVTIRPGKPERENEDKYAGEMGIKPLKQHIANGVMVTEYPSGKRTIQKVNYSPSGKESVQHETPDERKKREIDTAVAKTEETFKKKEELQKGKEDRAFSVKSEANAKTLIEAARKLKEMHALIKNNPKLTGWGAGAAKAMKLPGYEKLGEFDLNANDLQADYAKLETSRPGIGMVNFYKGSKPGSDKDADYNFGMLKANARKVKSLLENEKADWERHNPGKEFPYKIPDLSDMESGKEKETKSINGITYEKDDDGKWYPK